MKKTKVPVQQQGFFIYNVNQSQEACTKPETAKLKEFVVFFCSDVSLTKQSDKMAGHLSVPDQSEGT